MPQYGQVPLSLLAESPAEGEEPATPWEYKDALYQQIAFEVPASEALRLLPEALALTSTPYAKIAVVRYADSPIGAYTEALLLLGCRLMMAPHLYVVASIVSSERARTANSRNWRYSSSVGAVSLEWSNDAVIGTVGTPSGLTLCVLSPRPIETEPGMARYDALVVGGADDGRATLFQIGQDATVRRAWMARSSSIEYADGDAADPWLRLRPRNPITCSIAEQEMVRPAPLASPVPAVNGLSPSG